MNAYMKRQAAQRERQQARTARVREERQTETALQVERTIHDYAEAYMKLHGVEPEIKYSNGWYRIKRGTKEFSYRWSEVAVLTSELRAKIHAAMMRQDVEQYESIEAD